MGLDSLSKSFVVLQRDVGGLYTESLEDFDRFGSTRPDGNVESARLDQLEPETRISTEDC